MHKFFNFLSNNLLLDEKLKEKKKKDLLEEHFSPKNKTTTEGWAGVPVVIFYPGVNKSVSDLVSFI